jgi:sensor histidine kinase YesM
MTAIVVALVLVGLIAFLICILGSYHYDLRRMDARMQEVEAQAQHLRHDMTTFSRRQLDALWLRSQEEVDRQIAQARQRHRR